MKNLPAARRRGSSAALLLVLSVTACQPLVSPESQATAAPTRARPTGTAEAMLHPVIPAASLQGVGIEIWHPWLGVEASLLESQVAEFNQDNEWGITVRARGHTGFSELYNSVTDALAGEGRPQLVVALPEHASDWDASGDATDLTNYVGDPTYGLQPAEAADFPAVFWDQDVVDGKRLGMPAQRSARLLLYNQDWARHLGFEDAPRSAEDFREQACAAHSSLALDDDTGNDGMGGWLVETDSMTLLSWMLAFGGGILEGSGYRFLSPRNLEAITFVKLLYDDGCAWLSPTDGAEAAAFAAREALFAAAGLEDLSEFARAMAAAGNADAWTVMSFPGTQESALSAYGSTFVVLQSTPEQQLASWLFIRWMLSPDSQRRWVEATGLFPVRDSVRPLLDNYVKSHPQWVAAVALIPEAQMQPLLANWRQVRVMLGDGFDAMFRSNTPAGRVAEILAIMDRTAGELDR